MVAKQIRFILRRQAEDTIWENLTSYNFVLNTHSSVYGVRKTPWVLYG